MENLKQQLHQMLSILEEIRKKCLLWNCHVWRKDGTLIRLTQSSMVKETFVEMMGKSSEKQQGKS